MANEVELTEREKELPITTSTSNLNHSINGFSGDSYDHSLRMAFEWMDGINNDERVPESVELVCYFKQEHKGKSILVSYKASTKRDKLRASFSNVAILLPLEETS